MIKRIGIVLLRKHFIESREIIVFRRSWDGYSI